MCIRASEPSRPIDLHSTSAIRNNRNLQIHARDLPKLAYNLLKNPQLSAHLADQVSSFCTHLPQSSSRVRQFLRRRPSTVTSSVTATCWRQPFPRDPSYPEVPDISQRRRLCAALVWRPCPGGRRGLKQSRLQLQADQHERRNTSSTHRPETERGCRRPATHPNAANTSSGQQRSPTALRGLTDATARATQIQSETA